MIGSYVASMSDMGKWKGNASVPSPLEKEPQNEALQNRV